MYVCCMYVYYILAGYTPIFRLYNNSGNYNNVRISISIRKKWGYWTSFYQQTSSRLFCTNIGHQGSTRNIKMEREFCQFFSKSGPPMLSTYDMWTMLQLSPITTTSLSFLIYWLVAVGVSTLFDCPVMGNSVSIAHVNQQLLAST